MHVWSRVCLDPSFSKSLDVKVGLTRRETSDEGGRKYSKRKDLLTGVRYRPFGYEGSLQSTPDHGGNTN